MLSSEVARVYFALRSIDEEKQVLADTLKLRQEALDMASARVEAGATNELDRVRAEAELAGTQAEIAALTGPRTELENTLALVLGRMASSYKVPVRKLPTALPAIPTVVPAELVQRRPDVASAMKQVEMAQAKVGVTKAAYFPKVTLGAGLGVETSSTSNYFERDSNEWTVGLRFSLPLTVGGQRKAAGGRRQGCAERSAGQLRRESAHGLQGGRIANGHPVGARDAAHRAEATASRRRQSF